MPSDASVTPPAAADLIATLRATGLYPGARFVPSPNCDERPDGMPVELLVVHNISLPPGEFGTEGVFELFTNRIDASAHPFYAQITDLRVSAHFFIRRDGEIVQFVSCLRRAWHAGVSLWNGRERCNDFSIGVELEGTDDSGYTGAQYAKLIGLATCLALAYPLRHATGHSDIAPTRKTDPGPRFEWKRFRAATGLLRAPAAADAGEAHAPGRGAGT